MLTWNQDDVQIKEHVLYHINCLVKAKSFLKRWITFSHFLAKAAGITASSSICHLVHVYHDVSWTELAWAPCHEALSDQAELFSIRRLLRRRSGTWSQLSATQCDLQTARLSLLAFNSTIMPSIDLMRDETNMMGLSVRTSVFLVWDRSSETLGHSRVVITCA
jgi:hypothetical protein